MSREICLGKAAQDWSCWVAGRRETRLRLWLAPALSFNPYGILTDFCLWGVVLDDLVLPKLSPRLCPLDCSHILPFEHIEQDTHTLDSLSLTLFVKTECFWLISVAAVKHFDSR